MNFYLKYHKTRNVWHFMKMVKGKLYPILHCDPEDCENMEIMLPELDRNRIAIYKTPELIGYMDEQE